MLFTALKLQRGVSVGRGLGLSHPDSPMESWEDEGGLATLRLLQHEPWFRGGADEVKKEEKRKEEWRWGTKWRNMNGEKKHKNVK